MCVYTKHAVSGAERVHNRRALKKADQQHKTAKSPLSASLLTPALGVGGGADVAGRCLVSSVSLSCCWRVKSGRETGRAREREAACALSGPDATSSTRLLYFIMSPALMPRPSLARHTILIDPRELSLGQYTRCSVVLFCFTRRNDSSQTTSSLLSFQSDISSGWCRLQFHSLRLPHCGHVC